MLFSTRINPFRMLACAAMAVACCVPLGAAAPVGTGFDRESLDNEELSLDGVWVRQSTTGSGHAWGTLGGQRVANEAGHWIFDLKVISESTNAAGIDNVSVRWNVNHSPDEHGHGGGGPRKTLTVSANSIPPAGSLPPGGTAGWTDTDWSTWAHNGGSLRQVIDIDTDTAWHAGHRETFSLKLAADLVWDQGLGRLRLGRYAVIIEARHTVAPAPSAAMVLPAIALLGGRRRRMGTERRRRS